MQTARACEQLEGELSRVLDAATLEHARHALAHGDATVAPHGSLTVHDARGRRVVEVDRHGTLLAALRWSTTGLEAAWLRLPDRSWLRIEPHAARDASWGTSDRVWHAETLDAAERPLTTFEGLDYQHVDRIPTLAYPGRLPPGAGSAVLNLIAALAADQGRSHLTYRGPYPGEQLFLTLVESFRYATSAPDPLSAFVDGSIDWRPAPHERLFSRGAYVQLRGRIEKVVYRQRAYYRPDWQTVTRVAPRRVRDVGDEARCSLWALGAAVDDQLILTPDGELAVELETTAGSCDAVHVLPGAAREAVIHLVMALSASALAPLVEESARSLPIEWGPVAGDLVEIEAHRVRVSSLVRERLRHVLAAASSSAERAAAGLAALTEIAHLLGDVLRSRAQERLAERPLAEQQAWLDRPPAPDAHTARRITDGVEAILADVR